MDNNNIYNGIFNNVLNNFTSKVESGERKNINYSHDVRNSAHGATKKILKRIECCEKIIGNLKPGNPKKIEIYSKYDREYIINLIKGKFIKYKIENNSNLHHNSLDYIWPGYYSGCCRECDSPAQFITKKNPITFIVLSKMHMNDIQKIINLPVNIITLIFEYL